MISLPVKKYHDNNDNSSYNTRAKFETARTIRPVPTPHGFLLLKITKVLSNELWLTKTLPVFVLGVALSASKGLLAGFAPFLEERVYPSGAGDAPGTQSPSSGLLIFDFPA
eukprot:g67663.t1